MLGGHVSPGALPPRSPRGQARQGRPRSSVPPDPRPAGSGTAARSTSAGVAFTAATGTASPPPPTPPDGAQRARHGTGSAGTEMATHQLAAGVQLAVELHRAQAGRGRLRAGQPVRLSLGSRGALLRRRVHGRAGTGGGASRPAAPGLEPASGAAPTPAQAQHSTAALPPAAVKGAAPRR